MLKLPTWCPKSITHDHDGNIIDGDVDVAFVVDFVVVEVTIHPAHNGFAIVVLSFGDIIGSSKTIGIFCLYMFMLFLVLQIKEDHFYYYFHELK
jgi:hypothetical protein